ncbi:glycosyltransferase family A protein [Telluribacter sp. SYSU D00476]|uniref:glycosyltransferase family 2 protein n=1 Tax=Telluribacter sp. SYSU D00476 TaxID=2811430 RepID=UPI001FF176A3|nr:glycosyltransferase family A protein [Telluribacter sp. SYSU D00476]
MKQPLVSVIMPAYNAEKYIMQSLHSLLAQTYTNWELLVADDGSVDTTRSLIDSFDDTRIFRFHQAINQGYLKTWNSLLQKARGEYITFLDADDYIQEERLLLLVNFLNSHPDVHICGTGIAFVDNDQQVVGERTYPSDWEQIQTCLYDPTRFPFCGSAVMIRREVAEAVGGYRDFFDRVGWEDHDWLIRCCERYKASNIPNIVYYYRHNPSSVTRAIDVSVRSVRKLVIKKIGLELANQRLQTRTDLLMCNDQAGLQALIDKYEAPYRKDPSRIYRMMSYRSLQEGDVQGGLSLALQGTRQNPLHLSNYLMIFRSVIRRIFS